ncbi:MAG TPA: helicase-associated domain-containing protein [Spirochaetota bacterium]|nr:helicase-associated domain-containing protein [Spirochaetota bacterium]HPR38071.1 helicase-associated domain-containing protein [Spirochaetota bacterium]
MKTLDDIIKRIQPEKQKELASFLNIKSVSDAKIKEALLNIFTLNRLLSSLARNELRILRLLYTNNDGISFGDIQKLLDIGIDEIERSMNSLNSMLLTYVIKNRQMLNKKMDKAFCLKEISDVLNITDIQGIKEYLQNALDSLIEKMELPPPDKGPDEKSLSLMRLISDRGGIITLDSLSGLLTSSEQEKRINELLAKGHLKIFNIITDNHTAYITVNEKLLPYTAGQNKKGNLTSGINVNNSFNIVANLLKTFDSVSSSGLFLTKQNKFRKIDIKKISERMLKLTTVSGEDFDEEEKAHLAMQFLNILGCLKLDKDIGIISLKSIAEKIEDPVLVLKTIFSKVSDGVAPEEIFCGTFRLPDYHYIKILTTILIKLKPADLNYLRLVFIINNATSGVRRTEDSLGSYISAIEDAFTNSLELLILCGVAAIDKGKIHITEPGRKLHALITGKKYSKDEEIKKSIYISPDFTLMVNDRDIDPVSLYRILAFTDIVKEDVVIEAAITKSSIINSRKRGMNIDVFIETLKNHAKNEIPQSLEFLINDWTRQTISVRISRPVMIYSSHSTFIDEILYSNYSKAVLHRISENYAIISLDSIDDIVKFSKKYDIILTIFEDEEN